MLSIANAQSLTFLATAFLGDAAFLGLLAGLAAGIVAAADMMI